MALSEKPSPKRDPSPRHRQARSNGCLDQGRRTTNSPKNGQAVMLKATVAKNGMSDDTLLFFVDSLEPGILDDLFL